jgi:hypothetical protein
MKKKSIESRVEISRPSWSKTVKYTCNVISSLRIIRIFICLHDFSRFIMLYYRTLRDCFNQIWINCVKEIEGIRMPVMFYANISARCFGFETNHIQQESHMSETERWKITVRTVFVQRMQQGCKKILWKNINQQLPGSLFVQRMQQ